MQKTSYHISKMDCPSEEKLIRLKLEGLKGIRQLEFDIVQRRLVVIHTEDNIEITKRLEELNLGSRFENTLLVEENQFEMDKPISQSSLLWKVLTINFAFFIIEFIAGLLSSSTGLQADSLDMLADASVYGLSLWAVNQLTARKKKVATFSGYLQLTLAILGLIEVIRRFIFQEDLPDFRSMIIISILALFANTVCLYLMQKSKNEEAHMKASMIFTSNDLIINAGVIVAGILVMLTHSKYPDLIIGSIVFLIVVRGAIRILKL